MRLRAGTSGYSYKEWVGPFYPEKTKAAGMLAEYARRLPTVEINNTFYRMPRRNVLEGWAAKVPETFRFVLKASRRITHFRRLKDAGDETGFVLENAATLGDRLGALLFQLPPNFPRDQECFDRFLDTLPPGTRAAFEFRHSSWRDDAVHDALRSRNLALCHADTGGTDDGPLFSTADWGYLRLRRPGYTDEELAEWASRVRGQGWREAFAFFKHEDEAAGPKMALRFQAQFDS